MSKPIDRHQFLIRDFARIGIIAQALKTGGAPRIVHGADKHIELHELNVHSKTILPVQPACLPFSTPDSHNMVIAHSKLTEQGLALIPDEVLQKLGIGPGSVLEWDEAGEQIVVRRVGRYTSEDVHRTLFSTSPKPRTLRELKKGVRRHIKRRHASR